MKVEEAIIRSFRKEGVSHVFTLMSEEIIPLLSVIDEEWTGKIETIQSRHEQGAVGMADGYARMGEGPAVCIVGRGPAIAQTGTSLVSARNNNSNVLYVVPESPLSETYDGKGFRQETYLETTIEDVVSIRSPDVLIPKLKDAFRRLRNDDGPIAVQIPLDLFGTQITDPTPITSAADAAVGDQNARLEPDERKVKEAVERYRESGRSNPPIVLAGQGVIRSEAADAVEELADRMDALVATTLRTNGLFADNPYSLGVMGGFSGVTTNELIRESDFILALGCSLNSYTVDEGNLLSEGVDLVHVDSDPTSINRFTAVDVGILGDARQTAKAIKREIERVEVESGTFRTQAMRERIADGVLGTDKDFEDVPGTLDPRVVINTLNTAVPDDRTVVSDLGHFSGWVLDGMTVVGPENYIWTGDFVAIGQALPVGIGATVGTDARCCITFCGDAGLMMSIQELETAVRNDIPIVVVAMNDERLGAEYYQALDAGYTGDAAMVESPDFATIAEGMGADGYTVSSTSDLESVADKLRTPPTSPVVIDCKVNHEITHRLVE